MKDVRKIWYLGVVIIMLSGLTLSGMAEDWPQKYPIREDIPGPYSYENISQKDYSGIRLRVITHEIPVMGEPTRLHAEQFEELTGATVEVQHVPFGELYQTAMLALKKNEVDVLFYGSLWIADFFPYLEPLPEKMLASPQFHDVLQHYKDVAGWGDVYYQVPIDGDRHYLQYRRDLLENVEFREQFQNTYQRPLTPPATWQEYVQVAEFFHGKEANSGQIMAGTAEITNKDDLLFSQFIKRAAPYAKHPDVTGGFYFDLATMTPLINTPGFVKALEDFVAAQEFYPESGQNWGLADIITSFGTGQVVLSDSWDDAFIQAMEPDSPIRHQVAAGLSPGSRQVWNRVTEQWDEFPTVNYVPYIAWGWTSAVAKGSHHKEAAFDFLGFFGNEANHASDLLIGRYGVNPFRKADLSEAFWVEHAGWEPAVASSYVTTFSKMDQTSNRVLDLRIHQGRLYMRSLATGVSRALTGRSTPQAALDEVAREWTRLNRRIGIDKQREAYAHVVKFEDNQ